MSSESRLFYVESSVFLAFFKGEPGRVEDSEAILLRGEARDIKVVTSALTLAEVGSSREYVSESTAKKINESLL